MTIQKPEADLARKRRHRNERIAAAILVALLCAVAASIVAWRRVVERQYGEITTYIPQPAVITPEVELLAEYIRIDTSTPEGAARGAHWMAEQLRKRGLPAEIIESAPGRLNVYSRISGRSPGQGLLLFNHIDVVPPGKGWTHPPFEARIVGNQLYGRGAIDMKGLAICQLLAMADLAARGRTPEHDLVFLATADEETGSDYGMKWIVENRPDLLEGVAYGISEGGVTEMMSERMTYFGIEIGGKQVVQVTVIGDSAEAVDAARFALEPWVASRHPGRVIPAVRRFFSQLAPTRVAFQPYLEDIDATIRKGEFWRLPASYRDLVQNSLWMSGVYREGDRWAMRVRLVNLPDEDPDARLKWLESVIGPHGVHLFAVESKGMPVPLSSDATPLFELLSKEALKRYKVTAGTQILYQSASDSRFLRPLGITCYGICPFPVDYFQSVTIHRSNERVRLDYFRDGVAFMREVVHAWANAN